MTRSLMIRYITVFTVENIVITSPSSECRYACQLGCKFLPIIDR